MKYFILLALILILISQLTSGTIGSRSGKSIRRDRRPQAYWIGVSFQIVLVVAMLGGIIFIH
jgi:hypothetical protein